MNAAIGLLWGDDAHTGDVEDVYPIYETSDKGLMTHSEAEIIKRARWCFIPELQNVKSLTPMVKHWTEGKPEIYKRQDKRRTYTEEIQLGPLPILTALAEGNEVMKGLGAEMKRRFLNLWTVHSKKQNEEIRKRKAQLRLLPESDVRTMTIEKVNLLRQHMLNSINLKIDVCVNPCIMEVSNAIPSKFVVSNSYTDYFFDAIESVSRFYYNRNILMEIDGSMRLFSTPHDNKIAWIIVGPQMVDSCLSLPYGIGRFILGMLPVRKEFGALGSDMSDIGIDVQEISDMLDAEGRAIELNALQEIMVKLVASNFAKQNSKSKKYYRTQDVGYDESGINWSKVVDEAIQFMDINYPNLVGQYEERYCSGKGLEYIHPFTGVRTSILTDVKIKDDKEDELLNRLDGMFEDLSSETIEMAVNYYRLKQPGIPRLFFVEDIKKMVGLTNEEELSRLYDVLKEEMK
jgi:hypothetical protein